MFKIDIHDEHDEDDEPCNNIDETILRKKKKYFKKTYFMTFQQLF